ncbi:ribonuclease J [Priestia taiwanensis]|uniref:Ribonuclease J n=1 Tax=Priestia taiwanensis TaxID=1347902 RepID=A0A917EN34_9BACI|nr:ribonuclease J [Priestia taiwanensis]MBM7362788.1 ribonuclease J [Priestia taiwanensis]GGE65086.1 ribonuclease J [Priestia taiwanensis]
MKTAENIRVFALGGVGEIGKNMYVIEIDEDIFIIDAGIMFPDEEMFGIDLVLPDITYLVENKERVKGLFLTHGHEDHIGGVPYLIQQVQVPIYGTKLTLGLVEDKLSQVGVLSKANLQVIDADSIMMFDKASVSFFKTTHSIPDSVGVSIHTSQGALVCTGDFKFDQTPIDDQDADLYKMATLGKEGVLCLLSDSTNAEKQGFTKSERIVGAEIQKVFAKAEGRVIVASFASNIHRLQQVLDAAYLHNRKVAIVGRSMVRVIDIAQTLGYLRIPDDLLISIMDVDHYPERDITILSTGSQGEPLAALSRMAKGMHKQVTIKKGDTVIISATPIPGNELSIAKTVNLLCRSGADVIYGRNNIHVSGHGCQEELKLMIQLMKPAYLLPVHGEYRMQKAHAKLAEEMGMESDRIVVLDKGESIEFTNKVGKRGPKIHTGNMLIDGAGVGDIGAIVLRDRKLLSQHGIFIVIVTLSKEKKCIVAGPEIISRGFVYVREAEEMMNHAAKLVRETIEQSLGENQRDWGTLKGNVRDVLYQYLFEQTKRKPMILPIFMEV